MKIMLPQNKQYPKMATPADIVDIAPWLYLRPDL